MKVDRTKFTAQYENGVIRAIWATVEVSLDSGLAESPHDAFDLSKKITDEWYAKQGTIQPEYAPGPSTELPVINKAEERLLDLIEEALTIEELLKYKNDAVMYDRSFKRWTEKMTNLKQ